MKFANVFQLKLNTAILYTVSSKKNNVVGRRWLPNYPYQITQNQTGASQIMKEKKFDHT